MAGEGLGGGRLQDPVGERDAGAAAARRAARPRWTPPVSAPISTSGCASSRRSSSPPAYPLAPATATLSRHVHDYTESCIHAHRVAPVTMSVAMDYRRSMSRLSASGVPLRHRVRVGPLPRRARRRDPARPACRGCPAWNAARPPAAPRRRCRLLGLDRRAPAPAPTSDPSRADPRRTPTLLRAFDEASAGLVAACATPIPPTRPRPGRRSRRSASSSAQALEALIHRLDAERPRSGTSARSTPRWPRRRRRGARVMSAGSPTWGDVLAAPALRPRRAHRHRRDVWVQLGRFSGTDPSDGTHYDEDDIHVVADPGRRARRVISRARRRPGRPALAARRRRLDPLGRRPRDRRPLPPGDPPADQLAEPRSTAPGAQRSGLGRAVRLAATPTRAGSDRWTAPHRSAASATAASRAAPPPPRSGCGRGPGSAARRPATSCPRRPAGRCRRRRAGSTRAARPRPRAARPRRPRPATDVVDDERDVLLGHREGENCRRADDRHGVLEQRVEVDLGGRGAGRHPERRAHLRVQLAGVADDGLADDELRAAAGVPRARGSSAATVSSTPRPRPTRGPPRSRRPRSPARPWPHQPARSRSPASTTAEVQRLVGQRLVELVELAVGRPAVDAAGSAPARVARGRVTVPGSNRAEVGVAAADVARDRLSRPGSSVVVIDGSSRRQRVGQPEPCGARRRPAARARRGRASPTNGKLITST